MRLGVSPDQSDYLFRSGHPLFFLLGEDSLAIDPNIQRSWRAHLDFGWNLQLQLDFVLQADRLRFDIASEETTLDLNPHDSPLFRFYSLGTVVFPDWKHMSVSCSRSLPWPHCLCTRGS